MTPNSTRYALRPIAAVVAVLLLLAACGGTSTTLTGDVAAPTTVAPAAAASEPTSPPASVSEPTHEAAPTASETVEVQVAEPAETAATTEAETAVAQADADDETDGSEAVPAAVIATGGAVDEAFNARFSVHDSIVTTADPESYLAGAPEPGEGSVLITTVEIESLRSVRMTFDADEFVLELPDGARVEGEAIFDEIGERIFTLRNQARDHQVVSVVFELPDETASIPEADLIVVQDDEIPLALPLQGGAYASPYPLTLSDGAETLLDVGTFAGCSVGAEFVTLVEQADIDVEGLNGVANPVRMPEGERFVTIRMRFTGTASTSGANSSTTNCGRASLWPDFRLLVDGRPTIADVLDQPEVEGFSSDIGYYTFQIPATATNLVLEGGVDREPIAEWNVSLAADPGEPAAERLAFDSGAVAAELPRDWGDRPTTPTSIDLAPGGAADRMLDVDFVVLESTATNLDLDSFVNGGDIVHEDGRTHIVVGIDFESVAEVTRKIDETTFILVDPLGRPTEVAAMFDRTGDDFFSLRLDGIEAHVLTLAYETDGLVTDPTGWQIQVEDGDVIPLVLPLDGPAPGSEFPQGLRVGDNAQIVNDPFPGCNSPRMDVTVNQIGLDIEAVGNAHRDGVLVRTTPDSLLVPIELLAATLVEPIGTQSSLTNCDELSLFAEFVLYVDGIPTSPFRYGKPDLPFGDTTAVNLSFEIPRETQTIALAGGTAAEIFATWQLKDAGEVLTDFGAATEDEGTLITLDEKVLFAFGEAKLQQSATAPLNRVANVVLSEATGDVRITGHTDAIGSDDANQALSEARAAAVAEALIAAGVDADRLVIAGAGESQPIAPNENPDGTDNPAGRQLNRRVEIFFTTG